MDLRPNTDPIGGGRRIISIVFCDVRGSTAVAGQLDPEEWAEIMNGAFDQIVQPIYRYEGTVVRLLGDAVLAFFGAPIAREDDPQRAVLAGLEIQEAMQTYGASVRRDWGVAFSVRCGINTGLVVVGAVGSSQYSEYTAMGDAVNLAARMEQTAQPGSVQISDATFRLVAPFFEVEDLGRIPVKGKEEPQHAYRVIKQRTEPGSLRGIPGVESPMVGRSVEFATLVSAIERLQRGSGGVTFIIGEAGLGKSRLIRETAKYSRDIYPHTRWFQTSSFSYEKAQPYGKIQRLVRDVCGIAGDESPELQRDRIASTLTGLNLPDTVQTQQALEVLLGVADGASSATRLEGETFKGSLYAAMVPLWREMAIQCPLVVVFDDMQWADPASAAIMEYVLDEIGPVSILMLCAMRPSEDPVGTSLMGIAEGRFEPNFRTIVLGPLSLSDNEQLIDSLLPEELSSDAIRREILEKAAGNPLFVEEVVRVLHEERPAEVSRDASSTTAPRVAGMLQVPDNLQTLLTARVDQLEPDVRDTLLLASVLGPAIDFRLLTRISVRDKETLSDHMAVLEQLGLICKVAGAPEPVYRFVHILLQETAYRMILRRQRRQYHLRVAESLEQIAPDDLEQNAVVLAHHFDQASDIERASRYYKMAGEKAFRLYSLKEAIGHFSRALELVKQKEPQQVTEECTEIFVCKGRALELDNQYDAALENYNEMEDVAHRFGDRRLELAAMVARLPLYSVPTPLFNSEIGREQGEKALQLAHELGDEEAEARLLWSLSNAHALANDLEPAIEYGERSLALATKLDLRDQMARTLTDLGVFCYGVGGRLDKAMAVLKQAGEISRELNDLPMRGDDLASLALISVLAGEYEPALEYAVEAQSVSESINNLWGQSYSRYKVGVVQWERGDADRAIETISTCIRLGEQAGFLASQIEPRADLASIYSSLGAYDLAQAELDKAMVVPTSLHLPDHAYLLSTQTHVRIGAGDVSGAEQMLEEHRQSHADKTWPSYRGPLLEAEIAVAIALDDFERAVALSEELRNMLHESRVRLWLPHALYLHGRALFALGRADEARASLLDARTEADARGSRWMLWQIMAALADVSENTNEAAGLRTQARIIVDDIAHHVSSPSLRESFLNCPEVTALRAAMTEA
jgi:class 3 adenylate cyclase/tetratricopeptide (TPR) repeat protein